MYRQMLRKFPRLSSVRGYIRLARRNREDEEVVRSQLLMESQADITYFVLIIGSCAIATLGLIANSVAVIIGAMVVAPLMLPIRALAFGALEGDGVLIRRGLLALSGGTAVALMLSAGLGWLLQFGSFGSEILARSRPNLLDLGIAVVAGWISGYAKVQPKISSSLAGTAIAVALMPPLCVVGLGLSKAAFDLSMGAMLLYLTNLLGIMLSCMITFWLVGYTPLAEARRGLILAIACTGAITIPLTISSFQLIRQIRLENSLRSALVNRTLTFQRVELLELSTNWLMTPPEVQLVVRADEPVTPKQVMLLEEFVEKEMKRYFRLVFNVSQVEVVTRDGIVQPTSRDTKIDAKME
jgi:uncharacterized hydrophobic protein (TIGR00271 family)